MKWQNPDTKTTHDSANNGKQSSTTKAAGNADAATNPSHPTNPTPGTSATKPTPTHKKTHEIENPNTSNATPAPEQQQETNNAKEKHHNPETGKRCRHRCWFAYPGMVGSSSPTCIRGCTIRNQHTDTCDGHDATGTKPCTGCEPRLADLGQLCRSCWWRLDEWLSNDQPDAEWLAEPDASKRREISGSLAMARWAVQTATRDGLVGVAYDLDKIGVTKEPPAPVNLARLDWLRDLDDTVSSWLEAWVQHRGLSGPDVYELVSACGYLGQWLDELAAWEPVAELWDELADLMRRGHALAPWRRQARVCEGVPCPDCGEQALVIYGGDDVVTCYRCGGMQSRDSYSRWVRLLADEAKPKPLSHWVTEYGSTLKALQKRVERAEIPADGQDRNGRKLYYRDSLARILRAS